MNDLLRLGSRSVLVSLDSFDFSVLFIDLIEVGTELVFDEIHVLIFSLEIFRTIDFRITVTDLFSPLDL